MTTSAVSRAFCDTLSLAHFKMRHFALEGSFSSAAAEISALTTLRFSMPTKARFLIAAFALVGLVEGWHSSHTPSSGQRRGEHRKGLFVRGERAQSAAVPFLDNNFGIVPSSN